MAAYTLNIIRNGKTEAIALTDGETVTLTAQPNTRYQLLDEQGIVVAEPDSKLVNQDLWVFLDEHSSETPRLILKNYQSNFPVQDSQYLGRLNSTFITAADDMIIPEEAVTAQEITIGGSLSGLQVGMGAAALLGAAALGLAASGGGGGKGGNTESRSGSESKPAPVITFNSITADNVINLSESKRAVMVSGTVSHAGEGDTITLRIGDAEYLGKVHNGTFEVEVDGKTLAVHQEISATVSSGGVAAGNAVHSYKADTAMEKPVITFDSVTEDNIVNKTESEHEITLSGQVSNAPDGSLLTLTIGNDTVNALVSGGSFRANVSGGILAANNSITADITVRDEAGNAVQSTSIHRYRVDTEIATPVLTINNITEDNVINIEESKGKITITGQAENVQDGQEVLVTCSCSNCAGNPMWIELYTKVMNGTFSIDFNGSDLVGRTTVTAQVTATDDAGNQATAETHKNYTTDLTPPETSIRLDDITADNVINRAESADNVTISGKVDGEFRQGDNVTLTVDNQTHQTAVDAEGRFSTTVSGSLLSENKSPTVHASIDAHDSAGNAGKAQTSTSYSVKTENHIQIELNALTADNLINAGEAKKSVTLTGRVAGDDAVIGQNVVLTVNHKTYTATVNTDKTFSTEVAGSDLVADKNYTVQAVLNSKDRAGNSLNAEASHAYKVSAEAAASVKITAIENGHTLISDQSQPLIRINGKVNLSGDFAQGRNPERLNGITLKIGEKSYRLPINEDDQTFHLDVPSEEWAKLSGKEIHYDFHTESHIFSLTQTTNQQNKPVYLIHKIETPKLDAQHVELSGNALTKNDNGTYTVAQTEAIPTVTIRGIADGSAKEGDKVQIAVGKEHYEAVVQADKTFSTAIPAEKLAANAGHTVTATLATQDNTGNNITVTNSMGYTAPHATTGEFVSQHGALSPDKLPYFINAIDMQGNWGHMHKNPTGKGGANLTYHFATTEEIQAEPSRAGVTNQITYSDHARTVVKNALDTISKYVDITFTEKDTNQKTDINFYMGDMPESFKHNSGFAYIGGDVYWSKGYFQNTGDRFRYYISTHEIMHSLGAKHTHDGGKVVLSEDEDSLGVSNMSYKMYNDFSGTDDLRLYDLAFLHYRYGVNPNARKGNDTYTFKTFNALSADADIYIWDGAGIDTFDASNETQGVNVDLTPGSWIYAGEKSTNKDGVEHFAVRGKTVWNRNTYFDLDPATEIRGVTGQITYNDFTDKQAFIGYDTQIENLIGSAHNDTLHGNKADNVIYGGKGDDQINGAAGNDYIDGGAGADTMEGGSGNDTYVVDHQDDKVIEQANEGTDHVHSHIDYTLTDNVEHLTLLGSTTIKGTGNALDNTLQGNNADNILNGMAGNDRIIGGGGSDTLTGGEGKDTFVFDSPLDGSVDTITDFLVGTDTIELSSAIFGNVNTTMTDFMNYITYNAKTGHLSYDSDGVGGADAIHFATLDKNLELSQSSFIIG
ncbi:MULTISPECIES: Ig-like domain-containing protein [unclassified Neisseria]|uniref:Ig-like domain-containing protein n=1 Tax=unclassified Neisseria TaxID=2623750 RepID=UPI002665E35F|nr:MULTISPECIES: Ig-like domain-containing protein [unclassified Neisseria]MDO1510551.1 Ig-like domain-containing protein [Neisseria sp. MVDL19-042950]MDO1516344.1 Ig-like domain-containing protein [Neisseria sp. MVDL18-041461]MDO1564110.1 Ig-like domain-containing protein [Neisseria sp. MVDL20-010259]